MRLHMMNLNYEKHALRFSQVIAVLVKSSCEHSIFLATRVRKKRGIKTTPRFTDIYKYYKLKQSIHKRGNHMQSSVVSTAISTNCHTSLPPFL